MNYFCDSGGVIFHVDTERVFQGSANANVINFFGAFPSNAEVLLAYQLPNGTWTTPQRMTPIVQLSGVLDGNGNAYAGWQTRIGARLKMSNGAPVTDENGDYVYENDYTITENYGTVLVQFFVYANGGNGLGAQLATASSSFVVEKGVPIVLPITLTDQYETLLGQILAAISDKNEQIDTNAENIEQNAENISELQTSVSAIDSTLSETREDVNENTGNIAVIFRELGRSVNQVYAYVNPSNYVLSIELLDNDANIISTTSVDLPLESMVVNGAYDDTNQKIVLTLQNGNTIDIPVGDLVDGLISSTEKGQPNGVPTLGPDGKVPLSQLPDDIGGAPDLSDYVKSTDYATADKGGVVKVKGANSYGVRINENGLLFIDGADEQVIVAKQSSFLPITPLRLDYAVKTSITTNTETLTDEEQKTACAWIGATKLYAHNITDGNGFKFQVITNASTQIERSAWGSLIYNGDPNIRIATVNVFGSTLSTGITIKPIINAQLLQGLRLLYYDYTDTTATPAIYSISGYVTYEIQEIKGV